MRYRYNPALFDRAIEMFSAVMEKPEVSTADKEQIRNDINQLVEFFERQDRVEYVVRLYRGLLGEKYALLLSDKQKAKYRIEGLDATQIDTILEDLNHFIGNAKMHNITSILEYVFEGNKIPHLLVQDLHRLEQEHFDQAAKKKPADKTLPLSAGKVLIQFEDGYQWVLLDNECCALESQAMGHCGNAGHCGQKKEKILSLRSIILGEEVRILDIDEARRLKDGFLSEKPDHEHVKKVVYGMTAHLTFILHLEGAGTWGYLGEMKGRRNQPETIKTCKPSEVPPPCDHHPYIMALLAHPLIGWILGGGYKPQANFHLQDLSAENTEKLRALRPDLYDISKSPHIAELPASLLMDSLKVAEKSVRQSKARKEAYAEKAEANAEKAIKNFERLIQDLVRFSTDPTAGQDPYLDDRRNDPDFMALANNPQISIRLSDAFLTAVQQRLGIALEAKDFKQVTNLIKLGIKTLKGTLTKKDRNLEKFDVKEPIGKTRYEESRDNILEAIKKHPEAAANYASQTLHKRWPEAEPYICQSPSDAINYYARLSNSFREGEMVRWPEAEKYLITDASNLFTYLRYYAVGYTYGDIPEHRRIRELEVHLFAEPEVTYNYWKIIPWAPWPEAEPIFVKYFSGLCQYLKTFAQKRHNHYFIDTDFIPISEIFPSYQPLILNHFKQLIQTDPSEAKTYYESVQKEHDTYSRYRGDSEGPHLAKYTTMLRNLLCDLSKLSLEIKDGNIRSALITDFCLKVSEKPWAEAEALITDPNELTKYYRHFEEELNKRDDISKIFLTQPQLAFRYAVASGTWNRRRFLPGEPAILQDPQLAKKYHKEVMRGAPWPAAQAIFAENPKYRLEYLEVLKDRWEEVEEKFVQDLTSPIIDDIRAALNQIISYHEDYVIDRWPSLEKKLLSLITENKEYVEFALKYWEHINAVQPEAVWTELESLIIKDVKYILKYCLIIRKRWPSAEKRLTLYGSADEIWEYYNAIYTLFEGAKPWPEGEPLLASNGVTALSYAQYLRRRFPKGEKAIAALRDRDQIIKYAFMTGRRFIAAEPKIFGNIGGPQGEESASRYLRFFVKETLPPEIEDKIAGNAQLSFIYAKYIINGPWPKGEEAILEDATYAYRYVKDILQASVQVYAEIEKKALGTYGADLRKVVLEKRQAGLVKRRKNPRSKSRKSRSPLRQVINQLVDRGASQRFVKWSGNRLYLEQLLRKNYIIAKRNKSGIWVKVL